MCIGWKNWCVDIPATSHLLVDSVLISCCKSLWWLFAVVDGDDMSRYDDEHEDDHDEDALDQLEWELASQTGRVQGKLFSFIKQQTSYNRLSFRHKATFTW